MLLLEAANIEKSYRDRLIIKLLEPLKINRGDRIGIVGLNGAGKSTLMNILAKEEAADTGSVHVFGRISSVLQFGDELVEKPSEALQRTWGIRDKALPTMSGGEKTRLKIASALEQRPDLLFLDEPTSHLDLQGIQQLETELKNFDGGVVLISHDRTFLDEICTKILEIENTVPTFYSGNYSAYREQKEHERTRQYFEYEEYTKEKQRLLEAAREKTQKVKSMKKKPSRMSYKEANLGRGRVKSKQAAMMKNVKAMEKRVEQLDKKEKPREMDAVQFDIQQFTPVHAKLAIQVKDAEKNIEDQLLFAGISFTVKPGSRIALAGHNGCGKSTLISMIKTDHPAVTLSKALKIGYFNQQLNILNEELSILENISENSPYTEEFIRTILARLLFKREDVHKKVSVLSGGEKVKTALTKVFLGDYNLLLLDEPTNYLDIFTREALESVLQEYPGTIVFATHDRQLMNALADHVLVFQNKSALFSEGNYDAFQQRAITPENAPSINQGERLALELELADIIGRLSMPRKGDQKEALEARYNELICKKKQGS
ncbi:ABC-F type ribosomal protection protein [Fictibacillus sp. KIGAM418]|uniref:ABC-F type ribosomal protection protein n=1 Tax=Fictibacillus marinisediminis TaxID=2878389 RepID=A0A9X1XD57_9BACL|nr:ABC-F type ribosomal protection protein [Fictibacillus marinisediminis]MCK6255704.1 ABC-F type ribosomal protection protein [Fictibacillus marinisediminis]